MDKLILPSLLLALIFPVLAFGASFDCAKASTPNEKLICSDKFLSSLDEQLASAYKNALEVATDKDEIKKQQIEWLKQQRACKNAVCLKESYELRIKELVGDSLSSSEKKLDKNYFKLYGEKLNICESTLDYLNNWQGENKKFDPKSVGISFYEDNESEQNYTFPNEILGLSAGRFDFDNDGLLDDVFRYDNAGSYIYGTIIYVVYGKKDKKYPNNSILDVGDVDIYPCEFDSSSPKSDSCPPISQKMDGAAAEVFTAGSPKIKFNTRYTDIQIFNYQKNTYLLLRGLDNVAGGYWALIKPTSKSTFQSMCLFKKN